MPTRSNPRSLHFQLFPCEGSLLGFCGVRHRVPTRHVGENLAMGQFTVEGVLDGWYDTEEVFW